MSNLEIYNKLRKPPVDALKQIMAGRLKGMTDINPQWRYEALTEVFGPCGIGWRYIIDKLWLEDGSDGQKVAFALVFLYIKQGEDWSEPIPGIGGSTFIAKEKSGLHTSDEAYKMAVTDALSVACKVIGVAADIYAGKWDGSKYADERADTKDLGNGVGEKIPPVKQPPPDSKKKVKCPDTNSPNFGNDVAEIYCNKSCKNREGCPAFDEVDSEQIPF